MNMVIGYARSLTSLTYVTGICLTGIGLKKASLEAAIILVK